MKHTKFWILALAVLLVAGNATAQSKKQLAKRLEAVESKNVELAEQNSSLKTENEKLKDRLDQQQAALKKMQAEFQQMQATVQLLMAKANPPQPPTPNPGEVNQVAKNATTIEFEETEFNFGELTEGDKATHVFKFKNTGKHPLKIENARGSCGCTVPEWPKGEIGVGEEGEIKVVFNSRGKRGQQSKSVSIFANTDPSKTTIFIKGNVKEKKQ